ncbi:protein GLUTAMINE DUMPER 5-like [Cucurbita pepo subsp. pepo]|uniref:protein GLUTAMINE DUMPER 5-like n=1 Tax=Cucurbita pepo subsp. pepo TaxID=3664 RepID=UPI000C9D86E3|nr:protein GLUTAMINE DUMPER 5-like [Cucurbita pepo subsp. pepo]
MRGISPSSPVSSPVSQRVPWHSPVPYLFGGLAAMLGLIAFALLILACSYWKLAVQSEERDLESGNRDNNNAEKEEEKIKEEEAKVYEEKILVIMAGDRNPSFLATPVTPKLSSFSGHSNASSGKLHSLQNGNCEKVKEMGCREEHEEAE